MDFDAELKKRGLTEEDYDIMVDNAVQAYVNNEVDAMHCYIDEVIKIGEVLGYDDATIL